MIRNYMPIFGNENRILQKGKCTLYNLVVSGDGAAGVVKIYNGENALKNQMLQVGCLSNDTVSPNISKGIYCDLGCYITVNASTTSYTAIIKVHDELERA